ncbi:MAG: glycine zipper 2TM domain-containing protein [Kordiimonas sp.]
MFKKSLILLTTTAILLPMEAVSAGSDDRRYRDQDRAKQERAQRSRGDRSNARQSRPERARSSAPRRAQERSAPRAQSSERRSSARTERSVRRSSSQVSRARDTAVRDRGSSQNRQRATAPNRVNENRAVRPSSSRNTQTITRARDTAVRDRGNSRSTERARASRTRSQVVNNQRRTVRNIERNRAISEAQRDVIVRRDANGNRYTGYAGTRTTRDSRRVVRGSVNDRGRPASRVRELDYARDHAYRGNSNWDRGRVRDRRRGNYRRDWWYRDRWYRDVDVFFGFTPYYSGFGFSVGYHNGYYNGYPNGYYYGRDYYFGHWPVTSGYYHRHSTWRWSHHHHHYHYGDYCPHAHHDVHVTYHDDHHYSSSSSGNQVAGILLGGIVGGIIGAEIDGGRDKTAGAVIGSVVGAAIGASATQSNDVVHTPAAGVVYDAGGRHAYEVETYQPPREIKTCMRYETRQGEYVCTKWTVEYEYDD